MQDYDVFVGDEVEQEACAALFADEGALEERAESDEVAVGEVAEEGDAAFDGDQVGGVPQVMM
ncbi:hypothetical protein ACFTS5_11100 [Nocardia sp. NPDC056952]|uniref:hypothetical protein n=1 Tax=Nocardia sp. NPDC056952 TaxID=3345979 RepID=UPI00363F74F5